MRTTARVDNVAVFLAPSPIADPLRQRGEQRLGRPPNAPCNAESVGEGNE